MVPTSSSSPWPWLNLAAIVFAIREPSTRREFESLHERPGQLRTRTFSPSN
jgi:hypothetical protein